MSGCILCNSNPHDPRCSFSIRQINKEISDELSDPERELFEETARKFLVNPEKIEPFLNTAALVSILKLTRDAMLPGGKDPATTSLRAMDGLIKLNTQWLVGREEAGKKKTRNKIME